ncbi:MAG: acyltransferase [Dorea sp.]|nr:acyltransferase [Dorea sp.]
MSDEATYIHEIREREINYDWMRVFAMSMVILNHIADWYLLRMAEPSRLVYLCEGLSHCAIPLFLMLTGAFVVDKAAKETPKIFYLKSLKKLGIPFLIFIFMYYAYDLYNKNITWENALKGFITGFHGLYSHWYVVMLAVVYAFLPLAGLIKKNVNLKAYQKGVVVFFVWVMAGHYFESADVVWSLANMYFFGYVLFGNVLKEKLHGIKNNVYGNFLVMLGMGILVINHSFFLYGKVINGGDYFDKLLNLYGAPFIILSSVIIFVGFSLLTIKKEISMISELSYLIFLCHKLFIDIMGRNFWEQIENFFEGKLYYIIPVEWILIFTISLLFSMFLNWILKMTVYKML